MFNFVRKGLTKNPVVVENFANVHADVLYTEIDVKIVDVEIRFIFSTACRDGSLNKGLSITKTSVKRAVTTSRKDYENSGAEKFLLKKILYLLYYSALIRVRILKGFRMNFVYLSINSYNLY